MKKHLITCAAAALLLSGCSKEQVPGGGNPSADSGRVEFVCKPEVQVENLTRAQIELPSDCIPQSSQFQITVTDGKGESQKCSVGSEYTLTSGEYSATATCGDASKEGVKAACFEGEATFTIENKDSKTVSIAAKLVNSAVTLTTSEWFDKYYKDAEFTVTTSADNAFAFTAASRPLIFVQAASTLKLKGKAVKTQNGTAVEFPETVIGTTKACAQYTIRTDASQVGSGTVSISFNDELTEVAPFEYELNPEA